MWLPIGWAKGPSSSLLPYSADVKLTARLSALAVRKISDGKLWCAKSFLPTNLETSQSDQKLSEFL